MMAISSMMAISYLFFLGFICMVAWNVWLEYEVLRLKRLMELEDGKIIESILNEKRNIIGLGMKVRSLSNNFLKIKKWAEHIDALIETPGSDLADPANVGKRIMVDLLRKQMDQEKRIAELEEKLGLDNPPEEN